MKSIYRFRLDITDCPSVSMPVGALVLPSPPAPRYPDCIEIWAEVDTGAPPEMREFRIVGTGNPMADDCGAFVGTVITHGGAVVWHVFLAKEKNVDN